MDACTCACAHACVHVRTCMRLCSGVTCLVYIIKGARALCKPITLHLKWCLHCHRRCFQTRSVPILVFTSLVIVLQLESRSRPQQSRIHLKAFQSGSWPRNTAARKNVQGLTPTSSGCLQPNRWQTSLKPSKLYRSWHPPISLRLPGLVWTHSRARVHTASRVSGPTYVAQRLRAVHP